MRVCVCMYMYIRVDTFRGGDMARNACLLIMCDVVCDAS